MATQKEPDLSLFEKRAKPKRIYCWFGKLSPEQQEAVESARGAGHSYETISAVVSEDFGVRIKLSACSNHFSGQCTCDR